MATATAQQVAAMDAAQAEVERLLDAAEARTWLASGLHEWTLTASQEASLLNVRGMRKRFNTWIDGQRGPRRWAIEGRTDTGRPYTPQEWVDFGKELGELAAKYAELVLTHNAFTLYTPAGAVAAPITRRVAQAGLAAETKVRAAASAVADVFKPGEPWSWKTKLAVGTAVGVVVLGTAAYAASSFAPLLALLKRGKSPSTEALLEEE